MLYWGVGILEKGGVDGGAADAWTAD